MEYRDPRYSGTFLTEANGETEQEAIENFVTDNIDLFDEDCEFEIIRIRSMKVICKNARQSILITTTASGA